MRPTAELEVFAHPLGSCWLRFDLSPESGRVHIGSLIRSPRFWTCEDLKAEPEQTDRQTDGYIIKPRLVFGHIRRSWKLIDWCFSTMSCYRFPPPSMWVPLDVSREETDLLDNKQTNKQPTSTVWRSSADTWLIFQNTDLPPEIQVDGLNGDNHIIWHLFMWWSCYMQTVTL